MQMLQSYFVNVNVIVYYTYISTCIQNYMCFRSVFTFKGYSLKVIA